MHLSSQNIHIVGKEAPQEITILKSFVMAFGVVIDVNRKYV